ncbi:MAG: baseplate J/gp47 family protein [Chloroflexi bacterium]|nr:baseplate J/gp47 family protein [Chloroflexota bacterium]
MATAGREEIIYLDADDDLSSVRRRLAKLEAEQVALVLPAGRDVLSSPAAMRILRRQAKKLSIRLSIISNDPTVRRLARQESLAVFGSVESYRHAVVRHPIPSTQGRVKILLGLSLTAVFISLVALTVYLLVPEMTVVLAPASQPLSETMEIRADPSVSVVDYKARRIPARAVSLLLEGSEQVPVTGKKSTGSARAEGYVTFSNRTNNPIVIPSGTLVSTNDDIRFVTLGDANLAAMPGRIAQTKIVAVEPGSRANVGRLQITRIIGNLGYQVAVFNEEAISGGGEKEITVVAERDREQVRKKLLERMRQEALTQLKMGLRENESMPEQSVELIPLEEEYDKKVSEEARALNLKAKLRASGTTFYVKDVDNLIRQGWQPRLPPGFVISSSTLKIWPAEMIRLDGRDLVFLVRVQAKAVAQINEDRIRQSLRWKTVYEAKYYLSRSAILAKEAEVRIEPGWGKRALRIRVLVEGEATGVE